MESNSTNSDYSIDLREAYDIINKSNLIIFKWTLSEDIPTSFVSENISVFGYTPEDFYTGDLKDYWDFVYIDDRDKVKAELYYARKYGKSNYKSQYRIVCRNGDIRWVEEWVIHERDGNGKVKHEKGIIQDITEKKEAELKIEYLSEHDALTGLYNRLYFDKIFAEIEDNETVGVSIIIGDINGLKMVNDAFGHKHGDQLLIEMSKILSQVFNKPRDIIARLSGDEFVVATMAQDITNLLDEVHYLCHEHKQFSFVVDISLGYSTRKKITQSIESVFREADHQMYRSKLKKSKRIKLMMIESLKEQLANKSIETDIHSARMVVLAEKVGITMGLSESVMEEIELTALMHDIGMVSIDPFILNKPSKLSRSEYKDIMKHAEIGYHLLVATPSLAGIGEYVLSHHENFDGSGYPQGLIGTEIPIVSRIIAIVDAYESITNERVYRKTRSHEEALEEIKACSGGKYDPEIVEAFLKSIQ